MNTQFEFSDLIAGYLSNYNETAKTFSVTTTDGRLFDVSLTANTYARITGNLNEGYEYPGDGMYDLLCQDGKMVFVYGIYYPQKEKNAFEAKVIDFCSSEKETYRFEEPDWWIKQARSIGEFYVNAEFGKGQEIDYQNYRTRLHINGEKKPEHRQETDTISRMVYGLASAYMLTGEDVFLEAAEKGSEYLRDHMRLIDTDYNVAYWCHGIDVKADGSEFKVFASEFGDDYEAIPAYEQIYALAGLTQTYRITGSNKIFNDIKMTTDLFDKFFVDNEKGGYYSHVDPIMFSPHDESLGDNRSKKNWNSVGDHAPAYLINLWLATENEKYGKFLEGTADCITDHFQDYENSPFVQEKFNDDWSHDKSWKWQQDNGVIGHNLKIAWNLMRINSLYAKDKYVDFAKKIGAVMPKVGMDKQRFGWYDVVARTVPDERDVHPFAWHDRKAWWQQEQGILAYQILYGVIGGEEYLKYARESAAFYNAYFLDHDDGGIYFNVLNNGIPYLLGNERLKGSHSMACYHSIELCYLSAVYINLLHTKKPLDLYFKPEVDGFTDGILRVAPDLLPKGSIYIENVWIDGEEYADFDAQKLHVRLPKLTERKQIKVRIAPRI
ncbi:MULTISPECIES: AGE family epimerase/isomerase [unclassified Fusibacter]|uniref:AGE family epimerase/isomerase n=1 Tax=unclassified Fusibacter TaxID=2624464 RepID=UPI001011A218|nr:MULTISPECIES: AGE family epimerase/isomerase [unclassified Fusibacter]MCK8058466.1 AGE family epimerase/isomerase [Fusibacter sp. A2]NPE22766.1 N-acyl-D-glucosamine 2-epimerase [Fusibacter sp. A1]RXV60324.1 N-acyl-D-glucosamine 2-epimerase [Fusibacter sp. A1]